MTFKRPLEGRRRSSSDEPAEIAATRDFDAEIAATTEEAARLRERMAEAVERWLDATAVWAAEFWERSIATSVQQKPDAVMALDEYARTAVKEDAATLMGDARNHIERRLVKDRCEDWPHLKPQTDPHDHAFRRDGARGPFDIGVTRGERSAPEVVAGRLNGVLGDIASLFAHHGFSLEGFERGDPFGHRGRWHPNREHRPEWSTEMIDAMAAYAALHEQYVALLAKRARIGREQQQHLASELWESA